MTHREEEQLEEVEAIVVFERRSGGGAGAREKDEDILRLSAAKVLRISEGSFPKFTHKIYAHV